MAESLVLQAWRAWATRVKTEEEKARRTPRLPDATGIYLSEATGCPRKASMRILKFPAAKTSDFSQMAMASGIKGEQKIALVLEACGWKIERQHVLQTRYGNGRIDILADARDAPQLSFDCPIIIEVKTTTIDRYQWLPNQKDMDQCLLYVGLMMKKFDRMPIGEVTYLLKQAHDKNDSEEKIVSYPVEWDVDRFLYLCNQLDLIDHHVREGIPVPLDLEHYMKDKPPCQYPNAGKCVYYRHCWGNGINREDWETVEF